MIKIAFLCVNPWENFLPSVSQGGIRDYYRWMRSQALLREETLYCQEKVEVYGESKIPYGSQLFAEKEGILQLLYVQSSQKELIEEVFSVADVVLVGMPESKKECDKIFLTVLPWMEKTIFLWDERICAEKFIRQIQNEYKLKDRQIMEVKKLLPHLTEAFDESMDKIYSSVSGVSSS